MTVTSPRFELKWIDISSWAKTAALFLVPVLGIYVVYVQANFQDGFQWSDFAPSLFVQGSMVAYILNEVWALIQKWASEKVYKS